MPTGVSMMRFSTWPDCVTVTTSARPGPRFTNSMCFSGCSVLGAITTLAQRDRPDSRVVACSSASFMLRPTAAQRASMLSRSSSETLPTSSRPLTNSRSPASVGRRPAEVCGA